MAKSAQYVETALTKIGKLSVPYNVMGERVTELVIRDAPELHPNWQRGLAFEIVDGKDIRYFKKAEECMTFASSKIAKLSPDNEAPRLTRCTWSFTALSDVTEKCMDALVRQVVAPAEDPQRQHHGTTPSACAEAVRVGRREQIA